MRRRPDKRDGLALAVILLLGGGVAHAAAVKPDPGSIVKLDASGRSKARTRLVKALDKTVADAGLAHARVGIDVVSLTHHQEIYAHDADALLNPASNVKLFTSAAALELLGPEFRFDTEIYVEHKPDSNGVIHGNVWIKGKGDPTFTSERMHRMVDDLWQLGVRRITGHIILDDTYFDDQREGPGWEQDHSDHAYIAPTGALSLNFNSVAIHVRPGKRPWHRAVVSVDPDSPYFIVVNHVITGSRHSRRRDIPKSIADGTRQRIEVRGVQPINREGAVYYRRIDNPPYYFGYTFEAFLKRRGVKVSWGRMKLGTVPDDAELLYRSESKRLADVVETMDKVSNNHMAEQILKTLGAEVMGEPGSWPKGVAAVERWLNKEVGIPRGSYVMKNGSGLNDTNRFSPRQITKVLAHMWHHFQVRPEYVVALPVAGRDGTARFRMDGTPAAGVLRAKTGTLENVSALSGYVETADGEVLAFSILVNDYPGSYSSVIDGIDAVATKIAEYAMPPGMTPKSAVAANAKPLTPKEIAAKVKTYLSLGQAADPHNVRFLRTALRTERDPLLRAVVAEAIYRSDNDAGERLLLDNYTPTAKLVERLKDIARKDDASPTPVITSVADLAAEGNARALSLLLTTAHLAAPDASLSDELAETLVEVGRTAPDELLDALTDADPAVADTAITLIAQGLHGENPRHHPFTRALVAAAKKPAGTTSDDDDPTAAITLARVQALASKFDQLLHQKSGAVAAKPAAEAASTASRPDPERPTDGAPAQRRSDTPPATGAGGG